MIAQKVTEQHGQQQDRVGRFRRWRRSLVFLLAACFFLTALFYFRALLLEALANAWIVNDAPVHADAIVVLGGGLETRPFEAARLYGQGLASKILVMRPKPSPATELRLVPSDTELTRKILDQQGVPGAAIVILPDEVTSTYEESIALRHWAKTNVLKSVIITTDLFHTRRVRWIFRKELKNTGIQVSVDAVPGREYAANNWWRKENGIVAFQNEVLKFAYYKLKY